MPPAEVEVDAWLVKQLIAGQFPQWSALPLRGVPSIGWDNFLFRLGRDLVVRIPRRQVGADLIAVEHRWLPLLAPRLALPTPVPLGRGLPAEGYPWEWSVCPWLPGRSAAVAATIRPREVAGPLAAFLRAMHTEAPADAPEHPFGRGRPLATRDEETRRRIAECPESFDRGQLLEAWERALAAPGWDGPDLLLHGDLHPANMLVMRGRLSAVLDFGDLCRGDPAVDLMSVWMLLPAVVRPELREGAGVDADTWDRGRGWALALGLAMLERSSDNEVIRSVGLRAVAEVLAELEVPAD